MKFLLYLVAVLACLAVSMAQQPNRFDRNAADRSECYQPCKDLWGAARAACIQLCKDQYPPDIVQKNEPAATAAEN